MSTRVSSELNSRTIRPDDLNRFSRLEVNENKVEFNLSDHFVVKMSSRVDDFTLEHCFCRISIRKVSSFEFNRFFDARFVLVFQRKAELVDLTRRSVSTTWTSPRTLVVAMNTKLVC